MSEHDLNGCSQLKKREDCPGSAQAEANLTRQDTADSSRGDLGHAWMAASLRGKPQPPIPEDLIEPCTIALNAANAIQALAASLGAKVPDAKPIVLVEHRVDLSGLDIPKGGTIDYALVWPGLLAIFLDWKFGVLWTDNPKWNRQIQGYAWGLANDFGCEEVWGGICQPELQENLRLRLDRFTEDELGRRRDEIRRIIAWTKVADAPRRPGDCCTFCGAKDNCLARQAYGAQLSLISQPSQVFFAGTPDERKALWEKISIAEKTLKTAKEQILQLMIADPKITMTGYMIGEGRAERKWKDPEQAKATLIALALQKGLDPEVIEPRKLVSPAQAEDLLGKGKAYREPMEKIIEKVPGGPAIVPAKGGA